MKVEHREAIERAKLHGIDSMTFAHQLMAHDLVEAALFELRNIKVPFPRLGEDDQQEVIDRITKQAEEVVWTAVGIISHAASTPSRSRLPTPSSKRRTSP
ncbi:hypothetical protein GLGCALEP_02109 [Pseudomonas sp. MM221]|nr:hypothetical protein GLGCALEP_02109 [Pseudomonas sp. MM221]